MWGKVLVAVFLALALGVGLVAALGIEVVGRDAIADDPHSAEVATFEEVAAAHDQLFGTHVTDEGIDWRAMGEDATQVRALGALYARSGPLSGSLGATGGDGALAFRIDAFDALVALGIVEHAAARGTPLASVDDVHGVLDPGGGFGFFTAQVFVLDGSLTNLEDLRRLVLARGDARVLGLLHDGRRDTPLPPRRAVRAETLEADLVAASRAMTEPPYVVLDREAREIRLAPFYREHRPLFEAHAQRLGALPTMLAWIEHHASPSVRAALERAESEGFAIADLPEDRALSQPN